jgi:beta-galactosidase
MQANIKQANGHVFLSVNGQDISPVASRSFRPRGDIIADFHQHGFALYNVFPTGILCALADRTIPYSQFGEVWSGEGEYRWDRLKEQVDLFTANAPDGLISVNVHLDAPDWYLRDHPECADSWAQLIQNAGYRPWRESAARYLCDLIDKLDEWLPDRLYGVFLLAGGTTEWYTRDEAGFAEPLPIQTAAFRDWCGDPAAVIPAPEILHHTTDGCFRHPDTDREALRYWRFCNEIVTDCIQYFAAIAKRHTGGQRLIGAFTGYIHGMPLPGVVKSSYNEFSTILRDHNIDCIFCPASYRFRKLADTSGFRVPIDSYALYGKAYFHEIDSTTHLTHEHPIAKLHGKNDGPFNSLRDTAAYFRREVGMTLAKGQGYWWFDMFAGWYDDRDTMKELANLRKLTETQRRRGMRPLSEICLVTDLESNYYLGTARHFFDSVTSYPMAESQAPAMNRMGAPWDSYLTDDLFLDSFDHDRYKLYYFPNLFKPSERLLNKIRELRAAGKCLLFAHAPGYITDQGYSPEAMQELCGLALQRHEGDNYEIRTTDGISYAMPVAPLFQVQDDVEVLGTFADSSIALAVKARGPGYDAFSAAAPIPEKVLRQLAARAGCFQYINTYDPVYLNSSLLTVFCHFAGTRILYWPEPAHIREYFSRESYFIGPEGVAVPFDADQTKIFLVETVRA